MVILMPHQMVTSVTFPDKTEQAVKGLTKILAVSPKPIAQGVHVAPKKLPKESVPTGKQVIVEAVGGTTTHRLRREEGYSIEVFANSFAEAEELAAEVEEAWNLLSCGANEIKASWVEGSAMRVENETTEEQRLITTTAVFTGTTTQRARG